MTVLTISETLVIIMEYEKVTITILEQDCFLKLEYSYLLIKDISFAISVWRHTSFLSYGYFTHTCSFYQNITTPPIFWKKCRFAGFCFVLHFHLCKFYLYPLVSESNGTKDILEWANSLVKRTMLISYKCFKHIYCRCAHIIDLKKYTSNIQVV